MGNEDLELWSKILDIPVKTKAILDNYMLITYDIPGTEQGRAVRKLFFKMAGKLGAVQHTESVYFLPWTDEANGMVLEIAKAGMVYVWHTEVDKHFAKHLTENYDISVLGWLDKLSERLDKIRSHYHKNHIRQAIRMAKRTSGKLSDLRKIIEYRASPRLIEEFNKISKDFNELGAKL